jgi:hypothetical protein
MCAYIFSILNSKNLFEKKITFSGSNFRLNPCSNEVHDFDLAIQGDKEWNIIKLDSPILATGFRKLIYRCYTYYCFILSDSRIISLSEIPNKHVT